MNLFEKWIGYAGALAAVVAFSAGPTTACAQNYPTRPVKIIVATGPGGSFDIIGRLLADALQKQMGQPFVVENRIGAGSVIGTQAAVISPADGYTLVMGGLSNVVFNSGLYKKLPYDPLKDLVPVAVVYTFSYILVGSKDLPYSTPSEIVAEEPVRTKLPQVSRRLHTSGSRPRGRRRQPPRPPPRE
jgi:tripartite-type tricarboxylate transporter receptor subunit TctC